MAPHTEKTERIRSGVAKKIATKSIIEKTVLIQAVDLKQRTPIPVKKRNKNKNKDICCLMSQGSVYIFQRVLLRKISQAYHKRLKHYVMNIVHAE